MEIAIIGGGIGGLTTALALRQLGFEPQVFEQAPQLLEVGAAIAMWPNALRVLQRVGISETILQKAGVIEGICWRKFDGQLLNQIRLPAMDVPAVALHRADLQSMLLQALPEATVHLDRKFLDYQSEGDRIKVTFENHPAIICQVLIGADGLHSRARERLLGDRQPSFCGYTVWRGITDHKPAELQSNFAMEIQGRGKRFGIGPVGRGRIGWWASANAKQTGGPSKANEQQSLRELFAGWWSVVIELIEATPPESIVRTDAFDRPAARTWGNGPMTLLGDAIHPTTPNLGQGGCMAIEDAAVLARCLAKHLEAGIALRRYEALRFLRTATIANYSRLYGSLGQWEGRLAVLSRSMALSLIPGAVMKRLLRLIFDYDAYGVAI